MQADPTTAFVFPGQGSQEPGMGEQFADWPTVEDRLAACDEALPVDLVEMIFGDDADRLRETKNTQPAVLSIGAAVHAGVRERYDVDPDYVAGHSLGHFTAQVAAGGLDPSDGAALVRTRGELMSRAGEEAPANTMVAVLLADPETVAEACEPHDGVSVAVYNSPRQTVMSGTEEALERAREDVEEATRARFTELDVGAAFHSPVMGRVREEIDEVMAEAPFRDPDVPVVSDVTGEVYDTAETARRDLSNQLTAAIDWVSAVERLSEAGVERYVEFPPAGTLAGLVPKIDPDAEVYALEMPEDAEEVFG